VASGWSRRYTSKEHGYLTNAQGAGGPASFASDHGTGALELARTPRGTSRLIHKKRIKTERGASRIRLEFALENKVRLNSKPWKKSDL